MDFFADVPASRRVQWLARFALLWAAGILARLVYLQVLHYQDFREYARSQQTKLKPIAAPRGVIYDRDMHPLAMSVPVETITINPLLIKDHAFAAHLLGGVLGIGETELLEKIQSAAAEKRGYLIVARRVDADRAARLRQLNVDWIRYEPESIRRYPNGTLAAHLLGSVDHEHSGNAGVEMHFDDELAGTPGEEWVTADVRTVGFDSSVKTPPRPGRDVVLSVDRRIQFAADEALREAVVENQCEAGTAVALDPRTGEILALSVYPTYDPNEAPKSKGEYEIRKNRAVMETFEPGSIFKTFVIAGALERGVVTRNDEIFCHNGAFSLPGRVVHEAKNGYGTLTVEQILAKSSNIGAIKIGMKMQEKPLRDFLLQMGFNSPTGVELPYEVPGVVHPLAKWTPGSIGSVPMGHEVTATSLQLARAAAVIANNGIMVQPRITRAGSAQLRPVSFESTAPRQVIRPETAMELRLMLETAVEEGTGKEARIPGYRVGGKTGTAQRYDKATRKPVHRYDASFLGFAPVTNPSVVVLVTLHDSRLYGGVIAAPVFRKIAQTALLVRNVPRDKEEPVLAAAAPVVEPVAEKPAALDPPPAPAAGETESVALGPAVPSFAGKTVRQVLEEATAAGVPVDVNGSGLAREQQPAAGTRLLAGQRVQIRFRP
ncbi:MAG: penicillin-binding protein [Bryobacteraceae bacterium]|nr:penicillin-binding protein [Bryobacteraceae bacterium]